MYLAKHLTDLGGRDEISLGSKDIALHVVSAEWVDEDLAHKVRNRHGTLDLQQIGATFVIVRKHRHSSPFDRLKIDDKSAEDLYLDRIPDVLSQRRKFLLEWVVSIRCGSCFIGSSC